MSSSTSIRKWLENRVSLWRELGNLKVEVEQGSGLRVDQAIAAVNGYRELARDLTLARQMMPNSRVCQQLSTLYTEFHQIIYRRRANVFGDLLQMFRVDVPQAVRQIRWHIVVVTTIFILSGVAGWVLVQTFPELAALFASEDMIDRVGKGGLWTDDLINVVPSSILSIGIFTNNISVSLFACCLGVFFGLGTFYIIALNGMMLGSIFAFTSQHGLAGRLFEFIIAHGVVELSAICISGAVGASIGEALARPGLMTRRAAFEVAAKRGLKLMVVCVLFLVGAGIIEGYVSPNPFFPLSSRVVIGFCYMVLFVAVLSGPFRRVPVIRDDVAARSDRNSVPSGPNAPAVR